MDVEQDVRAGELAVRMIALAVVAGEALVPGRDVVGAARVPGEDDVLRRRVPRVVAVWSQALMLAVVVPVWAVVAIVTGLPFLLRQSRSGWSREVTPESLGQITTHAPGATSRPAVISSVVDDEGAIEVVERRGNGR